MKINQQFVFTVLVLGLISWYRAAEMSEDVDKEIREILSRSSNFEKHTEDIITILSRCDVLKGYQVKNHLRFESITAFFLLAKADQNFIAKVRKTSEPDSHSCDQRFYIDNLVDAGIKYLSKVPNYRFYPGKRVQGVEQFFYCVSIFEKADTDLSQNNLFSAKDENGKKENSAQLFSLFGKLLKSFTEINFTGKILHGDIKPQSIMVTFLNKEDEFKAKLDPVVSDFDMLISSGKKNVDLSITRYTEGFRPPEMDPEKPNYEFSKEFVEDVYALGATIRNAIQTHKDFIDDSACWIVKLQKLASDMIVKKEKFIYSKNFLGKEITSTENLRKNMKDTLIEYLQVLEECGKASPADLNWVVFKKYLEPTTKLKIKKLLLV